jgi:hypothetical protein
LESQTKKITERFGPGNGNLDVGKSGSKHMLLTVGGKRAPSRANSRLELPLPSSRSKEILENDVATDSGSHRSMSSFQGKRGSPKNNHDMN